MELRQLAYAVAVADEGGFGRAADRLGIVQSAVSQQVMRLERELGVILFDRSTRRVRPTAAGERLLPEARAVLAAADRTRRVAAEIAAGAEGVLRLGAVHGPGDRLYDVLSALSDLAPQLRVRLTRAAPPERLAQVRSGTLDAAFVRGPAAVPGLELLPLWSDPLYAALPAGHPAAALDPLRPADLRDLPLRLAPRARNPPFHDLITAAWQAADLGTPVTGPPFTTLRETLTEIADDAPSWTVLYRVSDLPPVPRIAYRPLAGLTVTTSLAVRSGPPPPALRRLLEAVHRSSAPTKPSPATGTGR
ncbi:LysR family transcriptional regulator [Kitasatospora sp. NBC_01246]|uniref:LysR substrate-binding domain-containing protein n=1 Tax=Kitasatospora sp. NBC_01246 TaxID=2903570 RepID=UPI002E343615|nr:LysR family transcriptional regulator [Kitasatospora sp. NBC_01246]